jgi:DNA-binding LacI/PurR family transcriptional regulator
MTASTAAATKRITQSDRIEHDLRERIAAGEWRVGSVIPGRRQLAEAYDVPIGSIQQAMAPLLAEGLLTANPRTGTVVAKGLAHEPPMRGMSDKLAATAHCTVGVVASVYSEVGPDAPVDNGWQRTIVSALERALSEDDRYTISLQNRWTDALKLAVNADLAGTQALIDQGVDALVVVFPYDVESVVRTARAANIPVVLVLGAQSPFAVTPQVRYDNAHAGFLIAEHLLRRGYRRLAYFAPFSASWEAIRQFGLSETDLSRYPANSDIDPASVDQCALAAVVADGLLPQLRPDDGVIAANDHAAYGLIEAAARMELQPGVSFGVAAFDDEPRSRELGLTSVRPPLELLGAEAARLVGQALQGSATSMEIVLRSAVVSRPSSAPVR